MKNNLKQRVLEYTAIFEPAEEGGYVVSVPALPGCATEGDTFEEAMAMIKEAIELYLEDLIAEGEEIPPANNLILSQVIVNRPTLSV